MTEIAYVMWLRVDLYQPLLKKRIVSFYVIEK